MEEIHQYRCRNPKCSQREVEVVLEHNPGTYRKETGKSPICVACGDGLWYIHPKRKVVVSSS